jgi:hypothetical protein
VADAWPEQKRLAERIAARLARLDTHARRRFAAHAATHVLEPFVLEGGRTDWRGPLVHGEATVSGELAELAWQAALLGG